MKGCCWCIKAEEAKKSLNLEYNFFPSNGRHLSGSSGTVDICHLTAPRLTRDEIVSCVRLFRPVLCREEYKSHLKSSRISFLLFISSGFHHSSPSALFTSSAWLRASALLPSRRRGSGPRSPLGRSALPSGRPARSPSSVETRNTATSGTSEQTEPWVLFRSKTNGPFWVTQV